MTIKCPKCQFSQPRDQYCARCGVDMYAFKAPPKPLLKRLSENLALQLFMVLLIGVGGFFYLRKNSKERFTARTEVSRTGLQLQSDDRHEFASTQTQNTMAAVTQEEQSETLPPQPLEEPEKKAFPQGEVKIHVLQVSSATLAQWMASETLTRVETAGTLVSGYINDYAKVFAASGASLRVLQSAPFPVVADQVFSVSYQFSPPNDGNPVSRQLAATREISITSFARLDEISDDSVRGLLEVNLGPQNTYPVNFDLSPNSALVFAGFARARTPEKTPESELIVVISLKK